MTDRPAKPVLITGASGNLGRTLPIFWPPRAGPCG